MIDDLISFLNARLDEDEARARNIDDHSEPWPGQWEADGDRVVRTHNGWVLTRALPHGMAAHIARHDPARVLREVEDGRRLVAAYEASVRSLGEGLSQNLRRLVLSRAAIYSDHPDYLPEWAPVGSEVGSTPG